MFAEQKHPSFSELFCAELLNQIRQHDSLTNGFLNLPLKNQAAIFGKKRPNFAEMEKHFLENDFVTGFLTARY